MKIALLSLLLLSSLIGRSQDTITVYSKEWFGGFSYSSGNDFAVYFPNQKSSVNVDSVDLYVHGLKINFPGSSLINYEPVCSYSFGWTKYGHYISDSISTSYYGIKASQITTLDNYNLKPRAVFYYSDGTRKEPFIVYSEQYLAYP